MSDIARFIRKEPAGAVGAVVLATLAVAAVVAETLPLDPSTMNTSHVFVPPGEGGFVLGTDAYGRDMLSRLIYGARTSLFVGMAASLTGVLVGGTIGTVGGYLRGGVDMVLQRIIDTLMAFPMLLLAIALAGALGPTLFGVILALALPIVPRAARVSRASCLGITARPYVESAVSIGCTSWRIIRLHIVPNLLAPLLIILTAYIGTAITAEAALSFLGAGIQEPTASWGLSMAGPAVNLARVAPWLILIPGSMIAVTVMAANLLGDALRNWLDPTLRRA